MITVMRAADRGTTRLDWLDSRHSFSFGGYYDPEHLGVSALRVINDDRVIPGAGFATHSHRDMEILSVVRAGAIEHWDSMGNAHTLSAGEFQLMSAGTGVTHSEYNPSQTEPLEFLQIWIIPDHLGVKPGYQQQRFNDRDGWRLLASPDGRKGSLRIQQDVLLFRAFVPGESTAYTLTPRRIAYVHAMNGQVGIDDIVLKSGDGATIVAMDRLTLRTDGHGEALLFDLPPSVTTTRT